MRRHLLAVELDSDMDLTTLASRRVQIEAIANNRYRWSLPSAPRPAIGLVCRQCRSAHGLLHPHRRVVHKQIDEGHDQPESLRTSQRAHSAQCDK